MHLQFELRCNRYMRTPLPPFFPSSSPPLPFPPSSPPPLVASFPTFKADHIQYIKEAIGAEHVGIGGDYDGCTELPDGLEDVSCYPKLTAELMSRGFTDVELKGILGGKDLKHNTHNPFFFGPLF